MQVLLDTNILLRSVQHSHPAFRLTRRAVRILYQRGHELCITPQNVAEFWNVCTRPRAVNDMGLSVPETDRHTSRLERVLTLLPDSPDCFLVWRRLVFEHEVAGAKVHDARLAALMRVHSVRSLLTFNIADFARFKDIEAVHPDDIV